MLVRGQIPFLWARTLAAAALPCPAVCHALGSAPAWILGICWACRASSARTQRLLEVHRSTGAAVLKRVRRWIIAGGRKPRFRPATARIPRGKRSQRWEWRASASLPWPASGREDVGAVQGHPLMCLAARHSWMHRILPKGTQKSWTPCSECSVQTELSTLPLQVTRVSPEEF